MKNILKAINEIEKNLQIWAMYRLQIKEKLKVNLTADTPRFWQYNVPRNLHIYVNVKNSRNSRPKIK